MIDYVQDIISDELNIGEKLIWTGSVDKALRQKPRRYLKKVMYWVLYIGAVVLVVTYSHDSEQGNIVKAIGKGPGVAVMIFLGILFSNFGSFFEYASPSQFRNKYHHFLLTSERMFFFSRKLHLSRILELHEIQKIDVFKKRNEITFYLQDPLEPTISFNGISDVLKIATLIKQNLPFCEEHAYLKETS